MSLGSRIKERREQLNMTRRQLADSMGITSSAVANYENEISSPKAELIFSLMDALKCDANYLYQDETNALGGYPVNLIYSEHEIIKKYRLLDLKWKEVVDNILNIGYRACTTSTQPDEQEKIIYIIPGYSMPMSAGTGQQAADEDPENYRLVKEPPRRASFIAPVSGDSMEPDFHNGDLIFVRAQNEVEIGQIGVFFMDGQQWIKERGNKELISLNPEYAPIPMREDIICQGLVLGVCDESYFE